MKTLNEFAEVVIILSKLGAATLFALFLLWLPVIGDAILAVLGSILLGLVIDNFSEYKSLEELSFLLIFIACLFIRFNFFWKSEIRK